VPILSQRALLPLLLARTPAELGAASVVHGGFRQVAGHHIRHGGRRGGAPPRRATPAAHCLSPSPALSPRRPRRELSPGKGASSLVRCIGSCGGPSRIPLDPPRYEGSRGGAAFFPVSSRRPLRRIFRQNSPASGWRGFSRTPVRVVSSLHVLTLLPLLVEAAKGQFPRLINYLPGLGGSPLIPTRFNSC
jgi:hypothetical protein